MKSRFLTLLLSLVFCLAIYSQEAPSGMSYSIDAIKKSNSAAKVPVPIMVGDTISDFCRRLQPIGRILETEGWYVWCIAPIYDNEGKVHVFYSRWPATRGMGGWLNSSEIAHAVADQPEGPYTRYAGNPVIDFSSPGDNKQAEDAYIWPENGQYHMLMRDMGFYNHTVGLYFVSKDGINWGKPQIAWFGGVYGTASGFVFKITN